FNVGATFSAGAFCCAAVARAGASSFFIVCADATPTVRSSVAATVDNSLALFIESSCGHLPTCLTLWRAQGERGEAAPVPQSLFCRSSHAIAFRVPPRHPAAPSKRRHFWRSEERRVGKEC